ncbi:branched-chain amino acid ABC transporter permease [Sphaerisporangium rubeum]|uniref:Branched-chain amino acid transport system permease protein n=1 Tax=Sphaerisporangium rubeum TaxID=321317 RepID=A0A7X0IDX6_9ACTN|nr:branched-chain amino acid transport system permease protein [Sphaerisporangium rubeum]
MDRFVSILASGITSGAIYALIALGIVLLQNATGVINFAQGDLLTLGAYIGSFWVVSMGFGQLPMYVVVLAALFAVGVLMERVGYAPLRNRSPLTIVISTFALGLALRAVILLWQGSDPKNLPSPAGENTLNVAGAAVPYQSLITIVVTVIVGGLLFLAFQRSALGRQVRALAADREAALLQGVRVKRLSPVVFGLSAALAGLAGVLVAPIVSITPTLGFGLLLSAFAAVILGGERLGGVAFAAMLVAMAQALLGAYLSPGFIDAYPFLILVVVLALRPQGLVRMVSGVRF